MEYTDARKYHRLRKDEQLNKTRIVYNELGDGKTLDVGCGTGISNKLFSNIIGIDPSKELISINPGICKIGKAEELPFENDSFENVICITAIHNFEDIEKGLSEMKRVGRKFGFSILKRSSKYDFIIEKIKKSFVVEKEIDEGIDMILICEKRE